MSSGAKKIEITQSTLLKLLIRRGSDGERKNITLSEGELGYTVDTQRLFIGDGSTVGAIPVSLELYYGSTSPTAYTQAVLGDIAYDSTEGALYRLIANDPTVFANWVPFLGAATTRVDDQTVKKSNFNGVPNVLMVKTVSAAQIDPQIAGLGLEFNGKTLQTTKNQTFDSINLRTATALQIPAKIQFGTTGGAAQYSLPPFDGPAGYSLVTNGQAVLDWAPGSAASQYLVLSGNQVPVGTILQYGSGGSIGKTVSAYQVPYGYFLCDGRTLSSSNYGSLYAAISTYYGSTSVGTFKIPALSSSNTVFLIKYLADQFIQQLNVTLQPNLTGFNTTTNAVVSSFTYPVDTLTTVNIGVNDYVSKTYVDNIFGSFKPTNTVYRLSDLSEPNGSNGSTAAGYIQFIDARNKNVRHIGFNAQSCGGLGPTWVYSPIVLNSPTEFSNKWEKPERIYGAERTTFVVSNSGSVYSAGCSRYGMGGIGGYVDIPYYTKINIPVSAGKVTRISVGGAYFGPTDGARHVFALTESGSAFGWGHNGYGQLAQGTSNDNFPSPVSMHTGILSATKLKNIYSFVGYSYGYSFAIDLSSNVYCCGYNGSGALGLGDFTNRLNWVKVPGFTADEIYGASSGYGNGFQSAFILSSGKLWGAGYNAGYNLGLNNNTANFTTFKPVCADNTSGTQIQGVSSLSVGEESSGGLTVVALMQDKTIKIWGSNAIGQAGIGSFSTPTIPTPTSTFAGSFSNANIVKVKSFGYTGTGMTFVLNLSGEIWAAGSNGYGSLGIGTQANVSIFTKVRQPHNISYKDFTVFASNEGLEVPTLAAVDSKDDLYVWGRNTTNQLGIMNYGSYNLTDMPAPIKVDFN